MKPTDIFKPRTMMLSLSMLTAACCITDSAANLFDDGIAYTNSTDTVYNEPVYLGFLNPDNSLLINSNSTLQAERVIVGATDDSTNNVLRVEENSLLAAGSVGGSGISTGGVVVGSTDGLPALSINNASKLEAEYLYVGWGTNENASVELLDEGTVADIAHDVYVGTSGSENSVLIGSGAALNVGGAITVGAVNHSDNRVEVEGTLFVNATNNITVVNTDEENGITISKDGVLQVGGDVNTASLSDLGVTMRTGSAIELGGTLTQPGSTFDSGYGVILNNELSTNTAAWASSSVTIIGETTSDNALTFTGGATGRVDSIVVLGQENTTDNNSLTVSGSNSMFTAKNLIVGNKGKVNTVELLDGGVLDVEEGLFVGFETSSKDNEIIVSTNALLTVGQSAVVGIGGSQQKLDIDHGSVTIGESLIIGRNESHRNSVSLSGSNSVLAVNQDIIVGNNGDENEFNLNHGSVSAGADFKLGVAGINNRYNQIGGTNDIAGSFIIGEQEEATGKTGAVNDDIVETTGNLAMVGTGAVMNVQQDLIVGQSGGGSILTIRDGGEVNIAGDTVIGEAVGDNYIYLQRNADTRFNVSGDLTVGVEGGINRFAIYGGTASIAGDLFLGSSTNQHESKNFIHLETTNAVLDVANTIYIGASNSLNTLTLAGGAQARSQDLLVGAYEGVTNNEINVTGDASMLVVSNKLVIGSGSGSNNTFNVSDGGTLHIWAQSNIILGAAADNNLTIADKGRLKTHGWDFTAQIDQYTNIVFETGSTLHLLGALKGTNMVEGGYNVILDGASATWNTGNNDLYVGKATVRNSLTLTNGAVAATQKDLYIGYESDFNNVAVIGPGSSLDAGGHLYVGYTGDNNSLTLTNGAAAATQGDLYIGYESAGNDVTVDGSGSTLDAGGRFYVGHTGGNNSLILTNGAAASVRDDLYIGYESAGNIVIVDGTGSTLDAGGNLYVGNSGADNALTVTNGAEAATLTNLYIGFASENNIITVGGAGSWLDIGHDLYIGFDTNDSAYNTLAVTDEALLTVGNDTFLYQGAVLKIDSSSQVSVAGDYEQDRFSTLEIGVSSNQAQPNLVVEGNAGFNSSADSERFSLLKVFDNGVGESNVITIVEAGSITMDGNPASSGSIRGSIATNLLLGFTATLSNDLDHTYIVLSEFTENSIGDAGNLQGQLLDVANEIDDMADQGDAKALNMRTVIEGMSTESEIQAAFDNYFGEKKSSSSAHNVLGLGVQGIAEQLTVRADSTRARMGAASAAISWDKPAGAAGPHQPGQQLQGWLTGFGTWGTKDAADGFNGYDANVRGFVVGADLSVARNVLFGIAGGAGSSSSDMDNGSKSETETIYASIYGSVGTESWFTDASLIYGGSSVDTVLGSAFDTTSDYDARNMAIYLGGGKEIIGEYLIFTPQASLLANYYTQDAYQEKSSVVGRSVEGFNTLYLQSAIGCNLGMYSTVGSMIFKPELRAYWLHEFNNDEESLNYTLIGGAGATHTLLLQAPEGDILKLGAGVTARISERVEFRVDLDTRQGSDYSDYSVLGSLRYQF